jgi:hypothetical protein
MTTTTLPSPSYRGYRFPAEIIARCTWLYFRFCLSFRDVQELMLERGIEVSHEAIRLWTLKFGAQYARRLRRRDGRCGDTWYLDEVFCKINGELVYLWRAVDQDGQTLDVLVQKRRNAKSAPSEPEALMEHDALRVLARTGDPMPWVLTRGDERWEGVPPGRATTNSPELLMRIALEGAGIIVITDHFALPYLKRGELVQVLPDWRLPPVSAWAVFPGRRLMPTRTRVFLDALAAKFAGPQCQAIEAKVQETKAQLRQASEYPQQQSIGEIRGAKKSR